MGDVKPLMAGKRGLIMGVGNNRSLAWGIAKAVHEHGAELAFTYQGEALGKRVKPLAESIGSDFCLDCDVTDAPSLDRVFAAIADRWQRLDFLVHAIAFSDAEQLKGLGVVTDAVGVHVAKAVRLAHRLLITRSFVVVGLLMRVQNVGMTMS